MYDVNGRAIVIGSQIVYPNRYGSRMTLERGTVVGSFARRLVGNRIDYILKVRKTETGNITYVRRLNRVAVTD